MNVASARREDQVALIMRQRVVPAAAIVLLTILAYLPVITGGGFIWDDDSYVTENQLLWEEGGLRRIWWPNEPFQPRSADADSLTFVPFWFKPETPQYYPLVFTAFWIEARLWGMEPRGYHTVNVLLHAINAVLIWLIMIRLKVPGGVVAAWLIGAVFALHPVHVESVAWITERKNTLSMMFYLLAGMAYLRFDRMRFGSRDAPLNDESHNSGDTWGFYALSLLLFLCALLSKSVTCSLPAALILVMLWLRVPMTVKRLAPLAPFFVIGFILAMNTALIERELVGARGDDFQFTFIERTLIATRALLFYPQKLLWPDSLMFIYPRWDIDPASAVQYIPIIICVIGGSVLLWLFIRGVRGPFVALSFYAGTVFPALGYFNVYPHIFSFVADHFAYHATVGLIACVVGGAASLLEKYRGSSAERRVLRSEERLEMRRRTMLLAASPILLALLVLTWRQSAIYESAERVYRDTVAKNPAAFMPHNNLSTILLRRAEDAMLRGDVNSTRMLAKEAMLHTDAAIAARPQNHPSHSNRAEALRLKGRYEEGLKSIRRAREIAPYWIEYVWQEGRLLHHLGRFEEAVAAHREAVSRAPDNPTYRHDLGASLLALHRFDEAAEQFEAILRMRPNHYETIVRVGTIRLQQGRYVDVEAMYRRAVEAAPTLEEQLRSLARLTRLLATAPDPAVRNVEEALSLAAFMAEATQRQDPAVLSILASVHAEAGDFEQAAATARLAMELAQRLGLPEVQAMLAEQLTNYERSFR